VHRVSQGKAHSVDAHHHADHLVNGTIDESTPTPMTCNNWLGDVVTAMAPAAL